MRKSGNYIIKIDEIINDVYESVKKKYKKELNGKDPVEIKIVITSLENHNFIRANIDICVEPGKSTIIEKYGCKFKIFSDFYEDKESKVTFFMYHNLYKEFNIKKINIKNDKDTIVRIGKFRIDFRLLK